MIKRLLKLIALIVGFITIPIWFPASIVYWVVTGHCSPIQLIDELFKWLEA